MVAPAIGSVVLIPFPFSDLSAAKLRPALVLAASGREDWICVQITSNPYADLSAIEIHDKDFNNGSLSRVSYIRPGKLFTANESLFKRVIGAVSAETLLKTRTAVIFLLEGQR